MKRYNYLICCILLFVLASITSDVGKGDSQMTIGINKFENFSGNPANDFIGMGIAEGLTTGFGNANLPNLRVIERTQLGRLMEEITLGQAGFISDEEKVAQVGKMLGCDSVVVGSFQKMGNKIRVDSRVVEVETSEVFVTASIEGDYDPDFFDLQSRNQYQHSPFQ